MFAVMKPYNETGDKPLDSITALYHLNQVRCSWYFPCFMEKIVVKSHTLRPLVFRFAAVFNKEEDIGTYTIRAVDDPRTLNKILYIRPPLNTYSFNDLVALWEKKIGKTLEKSYVPEEQVLKNIQG